MNIVSFQISFTTIQHTQWDNNWTYPSSSRWTWLYLHHSITESRHSSSGKTLKPCKSHAHSHTPTDNTGEWLTQSLTLYFHNENTTATHTQQHWPSINPLVTSSESGDSSSLELTLDRWRAGERRVFLRTLQLRMRLLTEPDRILTSGSLLTKARFRYFAVIHASLGPLSREVNSLCHQ